MSQDKRSDELLNTGYARLSPLAARTVLVALVATIVLFVGVTLSPNKIDNVANAARRGPGDVQLYQAEVQRIHTGEGYYQAAAAELTERGYPTRSVFNWRTPLPMWLIGKLPDPLWGKYLLSAAALVALLLGFEALARETPGAVRRPVVFALLLIGPLMPCVLDNLFVMPVLWAGVLIALSVAAYGVGRSGWGVAAGVAAIFCRDLALPYGLLSLGIALVQRRWREAVGWTVGLLAWSAFFGWHAYQVGHWVAPDAHAHAESWVQLNGAAFVVATAQMNAFLLLLPQTVTAVYVVAALFGLAGWRTPLATRVGLTVCLYVAAFAVVGQSFNQYWGCLIAPLLCFGVVRAPASFGDLWHACSTRISTPSASGELSATS